MPPVQQLPPKEPGMNQTILFAIGIFVGYVLCRLGVG